MSFKRILIAIILLFALSSVSIGDAAHKGEHYILESPMIVSGGGSASSDGYVMDDVVIGAPLGGKARSKHYILEMFPGKNTLPPNPPTVHSVPSPVNNPLITLSGEKEKGVSIYINGYEAVPFNNEISWKRDMTLCEGCNYFIITARNRGFLYSSAVNISVFLDTSPPTTPVVIDDGDFTHLRTQLHAVWSAEDVETGVAEYQYAIGARKYDTDIADWASAGPETAITRRDMTLVQGQTYYVSVKAGNKAGSWSEPGCSDGIKINQTIPTITDMRPPAGSSNFIENNVNFSVSARDEDGDSLLYQFLLDRQIIQHWQAGPDFSWPAVGAVSGVHLIKIEVSDNNGGVVSDEIDLYLFVKPIEPPTS